MSSQRSHSLKVLVSAGIGGLVEMYDFVIYIFLSPILADLFFPKSDSRTALLLTLAIFAVGYFSRPVGGIIFAHVVDRVGRRTGLVASVACMAIAIFLIGVMPTYAAIGIAAPIILLILRIIQGLSVGGEFPSAMVFLAEHAPPKYRGFFTSWLYCGINLGILVGSGIAALALNQFSHQVLYSWGWRIPFLLGSLLGILGFYIRRKLGETPVFLEFRATQRRLKVPLLSVLRRYPGRIVLGIMLVCLMAIVIGVIFLSMPAYLHHVIKMPLNTVLTINTINVLVFSLLIPFFAWMSDRLGRKPLLIASAVLMLAFIYSLFSLVDMHTVWLYWTGLLLMGVLGAVAVGPIPITLAELFPTAVRTTGAAVTYNISFGVFGGLAPVIVIHFYMSTHSFHAASYYLMFGAAVTVIGALIFRESRHRDLHV